MAQRVEPFIPEFAALAYPFLGAGQGGAVKGTGADPALLACRHQAGCLEHADMLQGRRHRNAERFAQGGNRDLLAGEPVDDRPAIGVGKGMKELVERIRMVKHVPN